LSLTGNGVCVSDRLNSIAESNARIYLVGEVGVEREISAVKLPGNVRISEYIG
jgi:Trm5-related predicted tRNA methylase|tara:strand:+ start:918 stop:1076 length:159 start_codon:yes stop_codon:yes gene_type:complete